MGGEGEAVDENTGDENTSMQLNYTKKQSLMQIQK